MNISQIVEILLNQGVTGVLALIMIYLYLKERAENKKLVAEHIQTLKDQTDLVLKIEGILTNGKGEHTNGSGTGQYN